MGSPALKEAWAIGFSGSWASRCRWDASEELRMGNPRGPRRWIWLAKGIKGDAVAGPAGVVLGWTVLGLSLVAVAGRPVGN